MDLEKGLMSSKCIPWDDCLIFHTRILYVCLISLILSMSRIFTHLYSKPDTQVTHSNKPRGYHWKDGVEQSYYWTSTRALVSKTPAGQVIEFIGLVI